MTPDICFWYLSGFNLMAHDSYFAILVEVFRNHILAENTYFTNHIERTETRLGSYNLPLSTKSFSNVITLKIFL